MIELLNDDAKATAFGNGGREIVREKFSNNAQLRNTIRLYNSLLEK
ncbi:MAG: hypothetical protein IPK98_01675 [Chloracidobacterium sp.]|nr:hypothetical protein [Chloracidobacterium sp.]